ncbi:dipeptide epimerase [uncultured Tessaracoccus sp.]|uniref:dipeptide epimerase n=1 Tax=uncultured Tessaracoccus sp. TaxID=905023 RepID=UPI002625FCD3|nr:dipeptide epimerase [uncultured Tessaracoccus sp.]
MAEPLADEILHVVDVRVHGHRSPLTRPFITAARRTDAVDYVVADVELATPDGSVVGQGSAAETVKVTGESAQSIMRAINGPVRDALVGVRGTLRQITDALVAATPKATSARAAVDVALHDALAKAQGLALGELLGRLAEPSLDADAVREGLRGSMANDMTVSLDKPETMARYAREAVADGYSILKIKLGADPEEDRRRLGAVLDAAPEIRLRLDANQGWDARDAIALLHRFVEDGLPIDLIEQPVPRADLEGLAQVKRESPIPIMADEAVWSPDDAKRLIDADAAHLLNIKLAKTGGLQPALEIAELAHSAGLECMVGAMMEPRISITAAAHLALMHPAVTMIDLDPPAWFAHDVPEGGYVERDGMLSLLPGPGLALPLLAATTDPLPSRTDG